MKFNSFGFSSSIFGAFELFFFTALLNLLLIFMAKALESLSPVGSTFSTRMTFPKEPSGCHHLWHDASIAVSPRRKAG